jgi:hypothetical protein
MLEQLSKIANYIQHEPVYIYLQVDESGSTQAQADILQNRLASRGSLAYFDPRDTEQSRANIEACIAIKELLTQKGLKVLTITTNRPFVLEDLLLQL